MHLMFMMHMLVVIPYTYYVFGVLVYWLNLVMYLMHIIPSTSTACIILIDGASSYRFYQNVHC